MWLKDKDKDKDKENTETKKNKRTKTNTRVTSQLVHPAVSSDTVSAAVWLYRYEIDGIAYNINKSRKEGLLRCTQGRRIVLPLTGMDQKCNWGGINTVYVDRPIPSENVNGTTVADRTLGFAGCKE